MEAEDATETRTSSVLECLGNLPRLAYRDMRVKARLDRRIEGRGYHLVMHTRSSIVAVDAVEAATRALTASLKEHTPSTASNDGAFDALCTQWALVERFPCAPTAVVSHRPSQASFDPAMPALHSSKRPSTLRTVASNMILDTACTCCPSFGHL